jgi:putative restriction endonuclease
MALIALTPTTDWDFPIFKVLANNDTGNAPGHQGGIVIPKDLRNFFPGLIGTVSSTQPTIDHRIKAELFVENKFIGTVSTRYQYQTWGGERSPESRLTDQLGPLRNLAKGNDVLVIQRNIDFLDHYRLTLIRKTCDDYSSIKALIGTRRWGTLMSASPISDTDLKVALVEEKEKEALPFQLIDSSAGTTTTLVKKVARSLAFRTTIMELYNETCSICGQVLKSPTGLVEVDAAHVVPRSLLGSDDARNGFALCKKHHWAFDNGLFGISNDRTTVVPHSVKAIAQNENLKKLAGKPILEATNSALRVHQDAFAWHRDNMMLAL